MSSPMKGRAQEPVEAHHLVGNRLDDLLLAATAGDVALPRVETVLAKARVDERTPPVQLLRTLLEVPPRPALASCLGVVGAVEGVRDDPVGNIDRDPTERVDDVGKGGEVDDDEMVDRKIGEPLDRLDRQLRASAGIRGIDLVDPEAGDF
jgi:hypothetical protein